MERSFLRFATSIIQAVILVFALSGTAAADPDLVIEGVDIVNRPDDGVYHPGDSFTVSGSLRNDGDEGVDDYTFDFYAGDYSIGSLSDSGFGAGWTGGFGTTCSLPSNIPFGDYTVWIKVSWSHGGSQYDSEASGPEITVAPEEPPTPVPPDLRLWHVAITNRPDNNIFYPGDSVDVECRVENIGGEASASYTVDFYADGESIGSDSLSGLEPGESDSISATWSLPDDISEGSYSITCELSCSNDSDSSNNSSSTSITVADRSPPNISIVSVDATDGIYQPGGSISVSIAIECTGGQTSGGADIDFYASEDGAISTDDYRIASAVISSLAPGESYEADVMCRFPADIPLGKYYIGIIATYPVDDELETGIAYDSAFVYMGVPSNLVVQSVDAGAGTYSSGDPINVSSLIKNIGGQVSTGYRINYYISSDSDITPDDYEMGSADRAALAADEQRSDETTCRLPSNLTVGNYYIGLIVTCSNDSDLENNVGFDSNTIRIVQPTDVVAGRLMYQDREGGEHPIRYALVKIHDGTTDIVLQETHTDGNGNYSARVPKDGQLAQQVRVKVYTEGVSGALPGATSKICTVRDEVFEEVYCLESDVYDNPADLSLTVNMAAPNSGGEFMIFDSIVEGFDKAREFFGVELKEVATFWPNSEGYSYFDPCEVAIHLAQDDRGDRDVIIHEYGHHLTHSQDFAKGDVGDNPVHYWNADLRHHPCYRSNEQAMHLAFREAWATLFSIASQYGDTSYPYSGDVIYQDLDEQADWMLEANLEKDDAEHYQPGQYFENMNTCALWDIFDDDEIHNEKYRDTYSDKLKDPNLEKIWLLSRYYKLDTILQFWDAWCENYGYDSKIKYVFRTHQMPYNDPGFSLPPDRPPVADAGEDQTVLQTCEEGAWVTLSGSGYDPDGDGVHYRWHVEASHRTRSSDGSVLTGLFSVGTTTASFTVRDDKYIFETTDTVEITVIATDPEEWTESGL